MPLYRKILCPIDFSPLSSRALKHSAELARQLDVDLSVVHIQVPSVVSLSMGEILPSPEAMVAQSSQLQEKLRVSLKEIQVPGLRVDAHLLMVEASVAETVLHRAKSESADLIVLGGHGRSQMKEFFLGSVANDLVRKASCPVLIFPDQRQA